MVWHGTSYMYIAICSDQHTHGKKLISMHSISALVILYVTSVFSVRIVVTHIILYS